jgi:hypothetical protein
VICENCKAIADVWHTGPGLAPLAHCPRCGTLANGSRTIVPKLATAVSDIEAEIEDRQRRTWGEPICPHRWYALVRLATGRSLL